MRFKYRVLASLNFRIGLVLKKSSFLRYSPQHTLLFVFSSPLRVRICDNLISCRDIMSNSFGEGYATRSNEEGFGGIYSVTRQLNKEGEENNDNSAAGN